MEVKNVSERNSRNGAVHTCTAGIPCCITQGTISGLCGDTEVIGGASIQVIDSKLDVICCLSDGSTFALPGYNIRIAIFGVGKVGPFDCDIVHCCQNSQNRAHRQRF